MRYFIEWLGMTALAILLCFSIAVSFGYSFTWEHHDRMIICAIIGVMMFIAGMRYDWRRDEPLPPQRLGKIVGRAKKEPSW